MKNHLLPLVAIACALVPPTSAQVKKGEGIVITPIEHASVVLQTAEKTIYVDPVGDAKRYAGLPAPDIILITHIHHDHFAPELVASLKKEKTSIIGSKGVIAQLTYGRALANGETTTVGDVKIEAIPAHNLTRDRLKFHPKGRDNGYVVTLNAKRVYISGDTEDIKAMRTLKDIDYAFVCMNLPYTMTEEQAASAVLEMKPKVVIPYHYRGRPKMSDLGKFKRLVSKDRNIEVRLLKWYDDESRISE
jgi:L-ascorbate metabolism protein UlaG (beta-lactamase superfamily)